MSRNADTNAMNVGRENKYTLFVIVSFRKANDTKAPAVRVSRRFFVYALVSTVIFESGMAGASAADTRDLLLSSLRCFYERRYSHP